MCIDFVVRKGLFYWPLSNLILNGKSSNQVVASGEKILRYPY